MKLRMRLEQQRGAAVPQPPADVEDDLYARTNEPFKEAPQELQEEQQEEEEDEELYRVLDNATTKKQEGKKNKPSQQKTEQKRQQKLIQSGPCPQGYEWDRRKGDFTHPCMKCKQQPADGYQCQGGSHWMCIKCIDKL